MKNNNLTALCVVSLLSFVGNLRADDLNPPPWRGGPLSTVAEWDFLTPSAGPPDGTSVTPVIGNSGGQPLAVPDITTLNWIPFDGTGAWTAPIPGGGAIGFEIPNWIDLEPIKFLQIQMTYVPGPTGQGPFTQNWNAFDPNGITSILQTSANDTGIPGTNLWYRIEQWEIRPNPDFEFFQVFIPGGVILSQVVVDSISVPEPSTLVLGSMAVAALAIVARRRRKLS